MSGCRYAADELDALRHAIAAADDPPAGMPLVEVELRTEAGEEIDRLSPERMRAIRAALRSVDRDATGAR